MTKEAQTDQSQLSVFTAQGIDRFVGGVNWEPSQLYCHALKSITEQLSIIEIYCIKR